MPWYVVVMSPTDAAAANAAVALRHFTRAGI